MVRSTRITLSVIVVTISVAVASPVAAQVVSVDSSGIVVDGKPLPLPATEDAVMRAFGPEPVAYLKLADEYSNRVFHWLNIGVVAFSNPRNLRVHSLEFLMTKPMYWKGVEFCGRIIVNKHEITAATPVSALGSMGFSHSEPNWLWKAGGYSVLVTTFDGLSIDSIEIDVEEGRSVPR